MAEISLPYVWIVRVKRRDYAYYRRGKYRHRIPGEIGTVAWLAEYKRIHERYETPSNGEKRRTYGSLGWLIDQYRRSPEYKQLSEPSRKDYERVLRILEDGDPSLEVESSADLPVATMPKSFLVGLRNTYSDTPRKANLILQVASILGTLAVDLDLRESNPAARIKKLKTGPGHRPWEEFEIEAYYARWPLGTPQRAAADLLLFGGQRRGDTIAMARTHYRLTDFNGVRRLGLFVAQEKTANRLWVPAPEPLVVSLGAYLPTHDQMTLLVDPKTGKPFHKRGFSGFMRDAISEAGLSASVTVHGARYTAATRLWEVMRSLGYADGLAWQVVGSVTGHETAAMARKYTEKRRLSALGVDGLNSSLTATPHQTNESDT